ncbi:MAG TPA: acyl carrier protein [Aggregatilineales bacterium]|nr:acyl carrier protein [Aggregatilineales bacterium]
MDNASIRARLCEYLTTDILRDPSYPLGDDEPLISSGLVDSFSLVDIALWVEQQFGVHLDNSELNADNFDTVAELAAYVEQRQ